MDLPVSGQQTVIQEHCATRRAPGLDEQSTECHVKAERHEEREQPAELLGTHARNTEREGDVECDARARSSRWSSCRDRRG